jgi:hypothetical protein
MRFIKEVIPLILDCVLERYQPKVIFLARHPAAAALCSYVQGWTKITCKKSLATTNLRSLV